MLYIRTLAAIIMLAGLLSPAQAKDIDKDTSFLITSPKENGQVTTFTEVEGTISATNANAKVWIIVHPLETAAYWVQQSPAFVAPDGKWKGDAQFGEPGKHVGKRFEIIAVADPKEELSPGALDKLPNARLQSPPVKVVKKSE